MNTEQQAKSLWCPMVRHEGDSSGSFNRSWLDDNPLNIRKNTDGTLSGTGGCFCIASQCAMWRWGSQPIRSFCTAINTEAITEAEAGGSLLGRRTPPKGWEFVPCEDDNAGWIEPEESWLARRTGYCGLAGKPGVIA